MNLSSPKDFIARAIDAAQSKTDPLLAPMVRELANRSEIIFTSEVEAIHITPSEPQHLVRINVVFMERHATADDDLLFLLLHEMVHRFHQDFHGLPRFSQLDPDNMAGEERKKAHEVYDSIKTPLDLQIAAMIEDIMVNARLCARWFPHGAPILLRLHDITRFPDILQIPPVLLDLHRGRVLELDPLYEPPLPNGDYDITRMIEPVFHTRIHPVCDRVENLPELVEGDDGSGFYKRDEDHWWVRGIQWWYWKAWSVGCKCSLANFYRIFASTSPFSGQ